jgi:serine phosphatase RsbU (regulator of sigma subunit)
LKSSIKYKINYIVIAVIALFSPILFIYFPNKQEKLLTQSYENEVKGIARTVALGVRIALEERNFGGVQTAIEYVRDDKRMVFVSMYRLDSLKNKIFITTIPEGFAVNDFLKKNNNNTLIEEVPLTTGQLNGGIMVGYSTQSIKDQISLATRTTILLSVLVSLAAILLGFIVSRIITKPITQLTSATKDITNGDLSIRTKKISNDEIGVLSDSFNFMIDNLQQNTVQLESQKEELKNKNQLITDSINYSSRIQKVLLNSEADLKACFPKSFIYFKPKDIVSGDFLWVKKAEQHTYIALVDCTGHGVPGAMMSIIGHFILNSIYHNNHEPLPGEILEKLNNSMRHSLKQETHDASDGMDVALMRINNHTNEIIFSGANRNLYHYTTNTKMTEYKGERKGIGGKPPKILHFENHRLNLEIGEWLVTYTDGIQDQFGTEDVKFGKMGVEKVMFEKFKEDGEVINHKLAQTLDKFMGTVKQIDDILVIGIKK